MDTKIKLLCVCVEYDDILSHTLPTWIPHVESVLVITSRDDRNTKSLAMSHDKVSVYETDAFYRNGAKFNKGLAIEEGFDIVGRDGWILVVDADIMFPEEMRFPKLEKGKLYTPRRMILEDYSLLADPRRINPSNAPIRRDMGHYGYFQLFHSDSHQLNRRPWYSTDWTHAGGADNDFQNRFSERDKVWIPGFMVIHIGPCDENWFGRTTSRIDNGKLPSRASQRKLLHECLKRKYGWCGRRKTDEGFEEKIQ